MLFSRFERTDESPKRWGESSFAWLDRSARPEVEILRNQLEEWVNTYPDGEVDDLVGRFCSSADSQHEGALFELLLHELLISLNCSLEVHPEVDGTEARPDFLVTDPDGRRFFLEATICMDRSAADVAAENRLADLRDGLDRISDQRFLFDLRWEGVPEQPVSARRIHDEVERDLRDLDHADVRERFEAVGWHSLPEWNYQFGEFRIRLIAIPRPPHRLGHERAQAVGMSSGGARMLATGQSIRDAIQRKAGGYGELSLPFVVAVNVLGEYPPDMIDVWNALLGREAVEVRLYDDGSTQEDLTRLPDGVWAGPDGPIYTRLSAVLVGMPLRPWNLHSAGVHLIPNPWAARPYDGALERLPRWVAQDGNFEPVDGTSVGSLLDLPDDWPEAGK